MADLYPRCKITGLKPTFNVISSDLLLREWHVWLTAVPLNTLVDQVFTRYPCFVFEHCFVSFVVSETRKLSELNISETKNDVYWLD